MGFELLVLIANAQFSSAVRMKLLSIIAKFNSVGLISSIVGKSLLSTLNLQDDFLPRVFTDTQLPSLSISRVVPAGIDNMSRTTPSGNMIASSGSSGIIPSSSEPNLYESVSAILQQ